jgi:hypothetical protein
MTINPKFYISERVRIIPLDLYGRVKSIWIDRYGIQYQVRYFFNSEAKEFYFMEDELDAKKS